MRLNAEKSSFKHHVYKSITLSNELGIGTTWLETVDTAKLLGVLVDSYLTFAPHIAKVVSRARLKLYGLLKLRQYGVNTVGLVRFYTACVRPALTYVAPVWYTLLTIQSKTMLSWKHTRVRLRSSLRPRLRLHL